MFATLFVPDLKQDTHNFYSVIRRKLNANIVILNSELRKKIQPKLAKPKQNPGPSDAITLANKMFLDAKKTI